MSRKKLKILLIEPNYSNKYPPIGLMKLSTYHKNLGHEVVFYKGELKLENNLYNLTFSKRNLNFLERDKKTS
jgi:hypothetical protein